MGPFDHPDAPRGPHGDRSRSGAAAPDLGVGVTALLGPTNTGKTHYAVERMLAHRSGVIGFPLRLLAREVYDRVVELRGAHEVGLITGEEKILPAQARYCLCTVESMPLDWGAEFLAVDEIQLCADPERGHIFTNRLLAARGRRETLFLGSETMRPRIAALCPKAEFITRDRFSQLSYAGSKKLNRLPSRSAIVAFSVDAVYAIAELLRRQKGGAAVVMGALSPRTRNAQVQLYQEGDVEHIVATDAIGMGLNLDVRHVAFAGRRKFDGRRMRPLDVSEIAQIAGRAGRHLNDGTFGVTGEADPLDEDLVQAIENHRFPPARKLFWRNAALDYARPDTLLASLEREPPADDLIRGRDGDDVMALRALSSDPDIRRVALGKHNVRLLWDVCQIPDFRKTMPGDHAALLQQIYKFLTDESPVIPEDWLAAQCGRLDRIDGDIDALSKRLAYIRTWTYVANRARWLEDPAHWRERTRQIEDKLSDALHARLTQRFVDRRTSVLARRLKQKETLVATVGEDGAVTVEGEFVGRLEGFRFQADPSATGAEIKTLQAASQQALRAELARRVEKFYSAPDAEIDLTEQGGLMWGASAVGRVAAPEHGEDPLAVVATPFVDEMLETEERERVARRLQVWIDRKIEAAFEPLLALRKDEGVTGLARGVAYQLIERFGVAPRAEIAQDVKALDQESRALLRKHGVRFGQHTIFFPALLKPAPTRLRMILWGLATKLDEIPGPPPPGLVTIPKDEGAPDGFYAMAGYRLAGPRAIRLDMLERLADMIRPLDARGGFEATPDMLSITGATLEQFAEMMSGLGYRAERGERPKTKKAPETKPSADAPGQDGAATAADADAASAAETATGGDAPAAESKTKPEAESETEAATEHDAAAEDRAEAIPGPEPVAAQTAGDGDVDAPASDAADASASSEEHDADTATAPGGEAAAEPGGSEADASASAADASVDEIEIFYTFTVAPRPRPKHHRRREGSEQTDADASDGKKARRRGGGGRGRAEDAPQGGERRDEGGRKGGGRGRRDDRKPHQGRGKPQRDDGPGGRKPREHSAGPPRDKRGAKPAAADPDSPFAILQNLKDDS